MIVGAMSDDTKLILKRSSLAHAGFDDFDVLCEGELVGRIYHGKSGSGDKPWFWGLAYGYHKDRAPTHGYEANREATMSAFAKSWRREQRGPLGPGGYMVWLTAL